MRSRNRRSGKKKNEKPITNCIPIRGVSMEKPWHGLQAKKPWDYKVTAVIPHLDTSELLETNIQLLQLQTLRPYIVIVDTGSRPHHAGILEEIENTYEGVEVHRLRFQGVIHPSDPVAIAMDLAQAACCTEFLYATHADCFLKRRDYLEGLLADMTRAGTPVAGYRITPRTGIPDADNWIGHTSSMFDVRFLDIHGIGWSQRRLCNISRMDHFGNNRCNGYPDTEFLLNVQIDRLERNFRMEVEGDEYATHTPLRHFIGSEENFETTDDGNLTHVRSYASAKLYSPSHSKKCARDMEKALKEAQERIVEWTS